jgi:hypothetical protein
MMPVSAQVEVGTTATIIAPAANSYQNVYIHNLGGGAVYLGGSDVTTGNGYKLDNGDKLSVIIGDREALYAVSLSGTHTVGILRQK